MVIVHVGTVVLQMERESSRRESVEGLIAQIGEQVRWTVARCIEEALEGEVTSLLAVGECGRRGELGGVANPDVGAGHIS